MGIAVIILGNAAAAAAAAAPTNWPAWIQAGAAVIGLITTVAILLGFSAYVRQEPPVRHDKFVDSLTRGVRKQTERLEREFAEALRVPPTGAANAQAYVRVLRRLLRESTAFVSHTRTYPIGDWPSFELADAFSNWAAIVDSTDSLLEDMYEEINAAILRHEWGSLHEQYLREEWHVRRDLDKLKGLAGAVDKAARPFVKKKTEAKKDENRDRL
ncbi:MAG: hypothetical protein V4574_03605 [Pseudomonadota bacterium]